MGCIGLDENGSVILVQRWVRIGDKTSTLEVIGIIIPFLLMPRKLMNQNVVLLLDNISVVYSWENHSLKNDICASIFMRASG